MNDEPWKPRKVVIVGAGAVGSTFAYALAQSGLADEIALRDANHELAMGQVLDLVHGQAFFPSVQIHEARATDYADARLIVITAGAKQRPGESRLELLQRNVKIIHDIIDEIVLQKSPAVVLIVSNPVLVVPHASDRLHGCHNLLFHACRRGIQQFIHGTAPKLQADPHYQRASVIY